MERRLCCIMVRQGEADTSLSPHVSEESNKSITAALDFTAVLQFTVNY